MPGLAIPPARQKESFALCVPPIRGEKCAPTGQSVGWVAWLQVALNVTSYWATDPRAGPAEAQMAYTAAKRAHPHAVRVVMVLIRCPRCVAGYCPPTEVPGGRK